MKGTLRFVAKAWWALVQHQLSPTKGDNMLSPERAILFKVIMEGYEIYVAKIIAREIYDRNKIRSEIRGMQT